MFHVDNEAVVHILNSRTSPDPNIMHLCIAYLKRLPASVLHLLLFTFQEEIMA